MSDPIEKFIRNNREKFDQQSPGSELWNNIQNGLAQQGAAGGASAGTAAKSGLSAKLAQISTTWKLVAGAVATLAIVASVYLATSYGSGSENGSALAKQEQSNEPGNPNVLPVAAPTPLVNPPLPEADVPFQTFTIKARKGGSWTASTGTVIEVPKGVFVHADGKPVKGEVTIQYREFHDAADIILSGITMKYDDNGTTEDFQTAGMMEIQGSQGGVPVYIREGEEIQIRMASYTEEDDYNLYYLDPAQGWEDIGKATIEPNKEKKKGLQEVSFLPPEPREPVLASMEAGGIDLDLDYSEFPELKPFKGLKWLPLDPEYAEENEWALTKTWSQIKLKEVDADNLEYRLLFGHRKGRFAIDVTPMFSKEDHEKEMAKFRKKLKRHNKIKENRKKEMDLLNAQADIRRSFGIAGFGIYNCDRFYRGSGTVFLNTRFEFPEQVDGIEGMDLDVYHVTGDNRSVMPYKMARMEEFPFFPSEENYLVILFPDRTVGVVMPEDFEKIPYSKDKTKKAHDHTFEMQQIQHKVNNAADLRFVLGV